MDAVTQQYYIAVNGKQQGPYDEKTIRDFVGNGWVQRNILVWKKGMANRAQISTLPEFARIFDTVPPPLPIMSNDTGGSSSVLPDNCPLVNSILEAIENHLRLLNDYANNFHTYFVPRGYSQEIGFVSTYGDNSIVLLLLFNKPELINRLKQHPDYKRLDVNMGYDEYDRLALAASVNLGNDIEYASKFMARLMKDVLLQREDVPLQWDVEEDEEDEEESIWSDISNLFG